MGRIIKQIILILVIILTLTACGVKNWKYDLPNNYQIRKISSSKMEVGYLKNNKLYTKIDDKEIGINKYVAEFQTSSNYIGLKCVEEGSLQVTYYLIDSKNQNLYGPYNEYDTYLKVIEKIADKEKFSKFKSTIDFE